MGVSVVAIHGGGANRRQREMVAGLSAGPGTDPAVLQAIARVPRESFVSEELQDEAYLDRALPIGEGQRIASPSLVARTLELLALRPEDKLLEVGTGSGYSAAVASHLAKEVYTLERNENLARAASCFLGRLGYRTVHVRQTEGENGWPEAGPFNAISVTFPAPSLVRPLLGQLAVGGRLVMAMGDSSASDALLLVTRTADGFVEDSVSKRYTTPPSGRPISATTPLRTDSRTCA